MVLLRQLLQRSSGLMILAAAVAGAISVAPVAAEAMTTAGPALVVNPDGAPIKSGGSATTFGLELPPAAACPGDTFHDDYLIYSYAIPSSIDPGTISFPATEPSKGVELVSQDGEPYVTTATAVNTGALPAPPLFSWSRFDHDSSDLPPGLYNVGIACAHDVDRVARYWNVQIRFLASTSDPGGFTWLVVTPQPSGGTSTATTVLALLGIVLVVAASAGGIALLRRRDRQEVRLS